MGWKTVEITQNDYLSLYLNNLFIKRDNTKFLIPIVDIDTLLLNNYKIRISLQLLNALTRANVNVIIMNNKYEPSSFVIPISGNHMSLKVVEKQLQWTKIYKSKLWIKIVQNKIFNQAKLVLQLFDNPKDDAYFIEQMDQVQDFDITNREGHVAKVYWHKLFGIDFIRDTNAYKNTIINSALNYGYAILRGMVIRSIIKKGLDPRFSLFHKSFSNFFALGSDLMEAFRPIVDRVVYKYRELETLTIDLKDELTIALTQKVKLDDKKFYLNRAIDIYIDALVKGKLVPWIVLWE